MKIECNCCNNIIATGYNRVVSGQRGKYVEFYISQINWELFNILPPSQTWRLTSIYAYYMEYRSNCTSNIKLYLQQRTVSYADYRIGLCYISPNYFPTINLSNQLLLLLL